MQLLYINVQRFRGGLVFKAHRLWYHSTPGLKLIKKKKSTGTKREKGLVPQAYASGAPDPSPVRTIERVLQ